MSEIDSAMKIDKFILYFHFLQYFEILHRELNYYHFICDDTINNFMPKGVANYENYFEFL